MWAVLARLVGKNLSLSMREQVMNQSYQHVCRKLSLALGISAETECLKGPEMHVFLKPDFTLDLTHLLPIFSQLKALNTS
jgi:hypothetical protein